MDFAWRVMPGGAGGYSRGRPGRRLKIRLMERKGNLADGQTTHFSTA